MSSRKPPKPRSPKGASENPIRVNAPAFQSESEEAAWWDANSEMVTDLLIKYGRSKRVPTQSVTLRLPVQDIDRARRLAGKRGVGYQTLIKSMLHDSLKQATEKA